jgi:drug/metabolite transporter (DMT)-like permease
MPHSSTPAPARALVIAAFATIYLVWGSTYLAIAVAIETLPPLLMAGVRFLVAGAVLYTAARVTGAARPEPRMWRSALLLGALFLLFGNGGVVWAEQRVASGLAAVLVATMPLWTVVIERLRGSPPPPATTVVGLLAGLAGVALLLAPGGGRVDLLGAGVLTFASISWAYASIISKGQLLPKAGALSSGMQMLAGGACLTVAGLISGDAAHLAAVVPSTRSLLALLYLIVFGSLLGFTAFTWLLQVSTPGRVATYAYVNPVVAVTLGWAVAGEPFGLRHLAASAVIIGGVALITATRRRTPPLSPPGRPR